MVLCLYGNVPLLLWPNYCFAPLAIRSRQNGWVDQDRPLVFLFLGSSGVGMLLTMKVYNTREIALVFN